MTGVLYDKAIFASACIAFAMLCICSLAQDYKASYWLNKGNESHEMMINETQNRTARDIFLQEARRAYDKAIEVDPQSASAWFKKSELQVDLLGDF